MSANFAFTTTGGFFLLDLLDNSSFGDGFDSAEFELSLNGDVIEHQLFNDLVSAQNFFSNNLIGFALLAGLNEIHMSFAQTMSDFGGFGFIYAAGAFAPVPLPASWMMMLSVLLLGMLFIAVRHKVRPDAFA
jgi:hypothetical protein